MNNWDTFPLSIPGLGNDIAINVPKNRLPVCIRCKHQYKTRRLCREKKKHAGLPWRKMYICITLHDSCFTGNKSLIKGPFVAKNISWQPYQYKGSVSINSEFPMCANCKSKNYTASYCRERRNAHRDLPWDTVYVELSEKKNCAIPESKEKTNSEINDDEETLSTKFESKSDDEEEADAEKSASFQSPELQDKNIIFDSEVGSSVEDKLSELLGIKRKLSEDKHDSKRYKCGEGVSIDSDRKNEELDFNEKQRKDIFSEIDESKTFCIEVSHYAYQAQWLDLDEVRAADLKIERSKSSSEARCDDTKKKSEVMSDYNFALGRRMHNAGYGHDEYAQSSYHPTAHHFSPQTTSSPYPHHSQHWSSSNYPPSPQPRHPNNSIPAATWNNHQYHGQYMYQQNWQGQPPPSYHPHQIQNADSQRRAMCPESSDPYYQEYPTEDHSYSLE